MFIELAYQLPKYKFLIVGDIKNIIEKKFNLPKNLIIEGFKQKEELKAIYIKSKLWCEQVYVVFQMLDECNLWYDFPQDCNGQSESQTYGFCT